MKSVNRTNKTRRSISQKAIAPIGNLPIPLSSFIGRDQEIKKVNQLVLAHRLVTLTGAGGSGKTRLALKSAQELTGKFVHGVWFVDLASLRDASLVVDQIVSTLGVHKEPKEEALDLLSTYLSKRHLLLILDNCEHLVAACAEITESLLQKSPELHILTTSRELLGIPSEVTWVVPPLTLPNQESSKKTANQQHYFKQVQSSESVQLFIERAVSKNSEFTLTVDNCESIAEICNRLDGMPLAIELAAVQVRSLSVQEIAQRLDQRFQFLTGGSRNAPLRQRTLMAAIDWSYTLLTTKEQVMLQRLSIFADGASLGAAEAICVGGEIESAEVLEIISHLVDKNLATANKLERGETRYRLLETIREYVLDRLTEAQDKVNIQNKHLDYFVQFAEQGDQKIKGAEQVVWFDKLEDEYNNLHAALRWALESKNREAGLKLSTSLVYFWYVHGHIKENVIWLEKFLAQKQIVPPVLIAWALLNHGVMLRASTKDDGDDKSNLLHEKSLRLFRELGDRRGIAFALNMMGVIGLEKNESVETEKLLTESLALQRELGDPWGIAFTMQNFPPLALQKNDLKMAKEYTEETVHWFERAGDQRGVARSLMDFAEIAQLEDNPSLAVELMAQSLPKLIQLGDSGAIADVLENLVISFVALRRYKWGALLVGATESLREEMGMPHYGSEYKNYREAVMKIQKNLSKLNFKQTRLRGRGMPLEKIVDYVTGETNPPVTKSEITAEEEIWFQLTGRERDVMRLLAGGHSNFEIAQKLFLSEKTIRNHISNIYRKLQITNRGEAILLARKLVSTSEE